LKTYLKEFWSDNRVLFVSSMFLLACVVFIITEQNKSSWIAIIIGIIVFFFIEYIVHRFVLHGILQKIMPKAYKGHEDHHNKPNNMEYLLTPNSYNLTYYIVLWIAVYFMTDSFHLTGAFIVGLSVYQLYYEWAHFVSHRAIVPITPWGKFMKKFHLLHHFKNPQEYYGVTNPIIDIIVGTDGAAQNNAPSQNNKRG